MHIATLKVLTIRQVWECIQQGDYVSFFIVRILISLFLLLSIIMFYGLCSSVNLIHWKVLLFGLATAPKVSLHLLNPFCSLASLLGFILLYIF